MKALRIVRNYCMIKRYFTVCHTAIASRGFVEEESLSHYKPSQFYPVHLDQMFCCRYRIAAKLGFGGSSTVWLCEDLAYVLEHSF